LVSLLSLSVTACAVFRTQEEIDEQPYVDDATITSKVKAALASDPKIQALRIHVATDDSTVELTGFVDSQDSANEAVKMATTVNGVTLVKDKMTVGAPAQ
jgi:osmotically-inducible protein OsmY